MIFQRGNPLDYERWAADPGMGTWDYAHCLPYFVRMENCLAAEADDEFRGHSGPLVLERGPATNPLYGAFLQAAKEAGYPLTDDVIADMLERVKRHKDKVLLETIQPKHRWKYESTSVLV
jgi:choline dehydrogenase